MEWKKKIAGTFELLDNGYLLGTLRIESAQTSWESQGKIYGFRLKNSWKQTYQFISPDKKIIGEMRPKNWFGSSSVIILEDQQYSLKFTNKPLAAVQLLDADERMLVEARLTTENGRAQAEFSMNEDFKTTPNAFWLASIIWHYFYPMAQSECGDVDSIEFLLLATA